MENPTFSGESKKFSTPAEELEFLRGEVARQEQEISRGGLGIDIVSTLL
jgi:hypothetical protein